MTEAKTCVVCGAPFTKRPTESRTAWAKRRCCSLPCGHELKRGRPNPKASAALRGRKQSPEERATRSEAMKRAHAEGRAHVINTTGLRGEQTSQWKGDDVGYRAIHARLRNERETIDECAFCGGPGREWALRKNAQDTRLETRGRFAGRRYSPNTADYVFLCRPCHRSYDGVRRDPQTGRYI